MKDEGSRMNKKREAWALLSTLSSPQHSHAIFNSQTLFRFAVALLCVVSLFASAPLSGAVHAGQANTRPRETRAIQAGEVVVALNEQLFNALIEAMFTLPNPP